MIENGTVPFESLGMVSYLHSIATGHILAVSTQYTNVTDIQASHRTTAKAVLMHSIARQRKRREQNFDNIAYRNSNYALFKQKRSINRFISLTGLRI